MLSILKSTQSKLLSTTLILALSVNVQALTLQTKTNADTQKLALAKELIQIDGSLEAIKKANEIAINQMKANMTNAPVGFFDVLMKQTQKHDYLTETAEIYVQNFSLEEMKAMKKLYNSPVGKSIASKAGKVTEAIGKQQQITGMLLMNNAMQEMGIPPASIRKPE